MKEMRDFAEPTGIALYDENEKGIYCVEVSIKVDTQYVYKDNVEAFDVAANALKQLLEKEGLSYE